MDIRIAAKAKDETQADEMIATIEQDVRARLGEVVFGADEDTLEDSALQAVASRGWSLTGLESNLNGLLARKISRTTIVSNLQVPNLIETLRAARNESKADVALGVMINIEDRSADMALITPEGEKTHHVTYGGPPRSLPMWSVNLALDWMRRRAMENAR